MKLYKFPNPGQDHPIQKETTAPDGKKLHLGPISFRCPSCDNKSELHYPGMIMRCVEFNCGDCGSFFKVVNPAFAPTSPPKKQK